jgi:hypothetical protein
MADMGKAVTSRGNRHHCQPIEPDNSQIQCLMEE